MGKRWAVVVACGLLLPGCGGSKPGQAQLTMWLVGSESQAQTVNALAKPFTERTGVKVRCEAISWGEAHSKYLTAVAGGVEPDIGTMGLTWGVEFGRLGALLDLRKEFPEGVTAIQQATFPGLWDSVEEGGRVFGIPFDVSVQLLFYRTDLIAQPPQTWDELVETLERLLKDNRRMIVDWGNLSWIGYAPFLWQAGGDFYNAGRTAGALTSSQAVKALEFFRDLYLRHDVPRTAIPLEQGMRTGDFPLAISGNWKIISLMTGAPEIADKWAIALLPKGPSGKRTAFLGGRTATIFARSPHPAEAWAFLQYLFEPSVQMKLYENGMASFDAYLPPNVASWEALPMDLGMKAVLKQQIQEAKGPPAVTGWTETTHALESAIQSVILKNANPKAELEVANDAISRNIQ